MSILIANNVFHLSTANTSLIFKVNKYGLLETLHYGKIIKNAEPESLIEKSPVLMGTSVSYGGAMTLDNLCMEYSTVGKGDYREPLIIIENADGTYVNDFKYTGFKKIDKYNAGLNAGSYGADDVLEIELNDEHAELKLFLYYNVFVASNTITRSVKLVNKGKKTIKINRILSGQLDLPFTDLTLLTFDGAWSRERFLNERPLKCGITVNDSKCGASGNRHNPFIILKRDECTMDSGECFGSNLIYSGNHYEAVEITQFGKSRILIGINPYTFNWTLNPNEEFLSPEAVFSYSGNGLNGLTQNMHKFINNNIVRGEWKGKERPIIVNSWEAMFFNLNENDLVELAKAGKELGAELFVLDDGWFGHRDNDRQGLGDWYSNPKKFPEGVESLAEKIRQTGMEFGIWVEPEMVNEKSDLYKAHPDWAVKIEGREPSYGRNQLQLDFTNKDVRDYIVNTFTDVFTKCKNIYVKWDYNRTFSDMFGLNLVNQGEFFHRYILGLYDVINRLVIKFPHILWESCASGGNRYDLGMLCYMPQTWCSDDTDAFMRSFIQEGTNYAYPISTMGAHVSEIPNNQTLRSISIDNRFNIAAFGVLGYELDIRFLNKVDKNAIAKQIEFYKEHRKLFQFGTYYRLMDGFKGNHMGWEIVSEDKSEAVCLYMTKITIPNSYSDILRVKGLDENKTYKVTMRREIFELRPYVGVLTKVLGMVLPIKIKDNGFLVEKVLKKIVIKSPHLDIVAKGDQLMNAGIKLNQPLTGCGMDPFKTRINLDFHSSMYYFKSIL